ncbi:MAG: pseudaminic acid biosynthesis-associated methylase [Thermoguttaceae bacterium]
MDIWAGDFGRDYTERNASSLAEMEELWRARYGLTRTEISEQFVGQLDRSIRILEVGANIGNHLLCLQNMGFQNLYGVELQWYAVEKAKERTRRINIIQGSAFDLPFKDGYFDLVLTAGVLIHIAPADIQRALAEIYRCTGCYIYGFEYFCEDYREVEYRGHDNLLWKADFARVYKDAFPDLQLVKEEKYKYLDSDNVDVCFLLRK